METKRDADAPSVSLISAQRNYIEKMLNNVQDMKVLLLDNETTQMVSMIYSQTDILKRQVYLTDKLANKRTERMMHLKAVVYIRPTDENIRLLSKEISNPKYKNYHIYFSNMIGKDKLSALARADEHEVIANVYEYYADYFAVNHDLFTLNISGSLLNSFPRSRWDANQQASFQRQCQGAMSALLSLKWKPIIRYQGSSDLAQHFARTLQQRVVQENKLFTFGQRNQQPPVCLILDRRDDPVTPLLTQWTYQAMVHELIGLDDNRVNLSNAKGIKKDMREVVLSCVEDEFFSEHMYDNFGDLGQACKKKRESNFFLFFFVLTFVTHLLLLSL
jgi:vacuolar protein sorting-associated protein 45